MTFLLAEPDRLARFRAGDRQILALVYRHYLPEVAWVLRAGFDVVTPSGPLRVEGLRSPHDVECGCHEVFLRAFRPGARESYDGERPYRNFLFRIARNWRIDQFRRARPEAGNLRLDEVAFELGVAASAEDESLDREAHHLVQAFVAELPERDRGYFRHRLDGASQEEAAARGGLTRIQGRRIEARVKAGLLAHLRRHGYGPGHEPGPGPGGGGEP